MTRGDASQRSTRQCIGRLADGSRCLRAPAPTSDGGTIHACCEWCEDRLLHEAFGPPSAWHDDARAHNLRPAIVGGVPIESAPTLGAEPSVPVVCLSAPSEAAASSRIDSPQGIGGRVDSPPASPIAGALRVADATPA